MDALDGLKALDAVVDALQHELKELHDERNVPPVERVSLAPLQWAIDKLADDLHTIDTEVKDLRLAEASARRGASEAQQKLRDEQLQSLSVFNELRCQLAQVTAERDAARQQHLVECRKYNAEVERRLALEKQVAELSGNPGELPAEPAAETYQWQVGDEIWTTDGVVETIEKRHADGTITLWDRTGVYRVEELHKQGWRLHRKASDLGVQQLTPRQVEISDSTGTDGEGQSK